MKKIKRIPIRINFDYEESANKIQETFIIVDEFKVLSVGEKTEIIKLVFNYTQKKCKIKAVSFVLNVNQNKILIENLSHEQKYELLEKLNESKLKFNKIGFEFYTC